MSQIDKIIEKIKDAFMFREGSDFDSILTPPVVTTGSIIWGVLLRSLVIISATSFLVMVLEYRQLWWFSVFAFWFVVAYPAYRQYVKYNNRIDDFSEETLCGKCKYFDSQSQRCDIYDQHVGVGFIPCEGDSWEPSSSITDDK